MADEEDDDVLEDWEDAADSGELERRMEEREKQLNKEEKESLKHELNVTNNGPVTILKAENTCRTEYTPQIKILKRSGNVSEKKDTVKQTSEAELKKTLKLREAEYQAARNRILGEDYDETKPQLEDVEEDAEAKISIIKAPPRETSAPSPTSSQSSGGSSRSGQDSNFVRQPKGPNSQASGFSLER